MAKVFHVQFKFNSMKIKEYWKANSDDYKISLGTKSSRYFTSTIFTQYAYLQVIKLTVKLDDPKYLPLTPDIFRYFFCNEIHGLR